MTAFNEDPELPSDLELNWEDLKMAGVADRTRRETVQVRDWWKEREANNDLAERVDVVSGFDHFEHAYGFFDTVPIDGQRIPVMGLVQEMIYDRLKAMTVEQLRDQVREFVLRYLMRVSHRLQPGAAPAEQEVPLLMKPFSWIPESASDNRVGFGYEQLLFKEHATGRVGKFDLSERGAIVDLRKIGQVYDWLAMRVNLFDFKIGVSPFGPDILKVEVPLEEVTYLLVTPELIINRDNPSPGVLGEYGFGYGLLPYSPGETIFAYGPGKFSAGFQTFEFQVLETGEVRAKAVFVVNRPDQILSVDIDPIDWSFRVADMLTMNLASTTMAPFKELARRLPLRVENVDPISLFIEAANALSGGLAGSRLGISKGQLEKHMLVRHFLQHRQMLITSHSIWRAVSDWTDTDNLPHFAHRGLNGHR